MTLTVTDMNVPSMHLIWAVGPAALRLNARWFSHVRLMTGVHGLGMASRARPRSDQHYGKIERDLGICIHEKSLRARCSLDEEV